MKGETKLQQERIMQEHDMKQVEYIKLDEYNQRWYLIRQAKLARQKAYAPYSHFQVGAALETQNGKIFWGCNIENATYSATNCAERTAIYEAIAHGEQKLKRIAIVGALEQESLEQAKYCMPCGICLQVMLEFSDPESFEVIVTNGENIKVFLLKELLPYGFRLHRI